MCIVNLIMGTRSTKFEFSTFADPWVIIVSKIANTWMIVIKYFYNQVLFVSLEHLD